jgi:hypothetical protein
MAVFNLSHIRLCLYLIIFVHSAAIGETIPDRFNLEEVGHSDLNGAGKGGEGLALKQYGAKKILFLAHESGPQCYSVIDVTTPNKPRVIKQIPTEAQFVRCNSLSVSGNTLIVARESKEIGQAHGGMITYDVTDPANPQLLSYLDLTGPYSRGTHRVSFLDSRYAYLSTGAKDFTPKNPKDDQMLMIVDMADPKLPKETGRWWMDGTQVGDKTAEPARVTPFDKGFRAHTVLTSPERPDRAYLAWIDGGVIVLDIADKAHPKEISRISWQSSHQGFMHTIVPILDRGILVASEETTEESCKDWPMRILVIDIKNELHPYPLSYLPTPKNKDDLCKGEGRAGAHNINLNDAPEVSRVLKNTVVTAQFGFGLRIFSIIDPASPTELAYFAPTVPGNKSGKTQINDLIVGKDGLIYAVDRFNGGLYILKYTGKTPLN